VTPAEALASLLAYATKNPEQTVTIATALGGVLTHYNRTGRVPLGRLPWRVLQQSWGDLADQYFGRTRPKGVPGLLASTTLEHLEAELRQTAHFESADDASFEYDGEVLNLRRPGGLWPHPEHGDRVPMELHLRVFPTDVDGEYLVLPHHEASRVEAWGAHIRGEVLSWRRGQSRTASILQELDIEHSTIESERAADVTVNT
jgi:hypothetical protein